MEIAEILSFIRNELVRKKHANRGALKLFSESVDVGSDVLSKFQTYDESSDPSFRTVYKILRGLLNRPPIYLNGKEDYLAIPLVQGRIAAHPSGEIPGDAIESWLWLPKSELHGRRRLVAVRLGEESDSMLPLLSPGATVVIDRADREITPDGLFAVRLPDLESCAVKRIQLVPEKKSVLLLSENKAYPPELVDWHEHLLIGRVVWSLLNWVR